jgi:hypothetical protein
MKKIIFFALACCCQIVRANVPVQRQPNGKQYTGVVVSGSVSAKYNIVFLGDGFTADQQILFNSKVEQAVNSLRTTEPYRTYLKAFNIWRVNVISTESGIDHPARNVYKNTALDCSYGDPALNQPERCISSSSPDKCYEAAGNAPAYNAVFILANDPDWGGCESDLVCSSIADGFANIITHELGHKIANLADEYTCYICDGSDGNQPYSGDEPIQVNITRSNSRETLKWENLVAASTTIPTADNTPPGVVGLFQGAGYYTIGLYRSQWNCLMQTVTAPFCAVCRKEMARILSGYCNP